MLFNNLGCLLCYVWVFFKLILFSSIKVHELSEFKDISNVVELEDETKGEMLMFSRATMKGLNTARFNVTLFIQV